MAPVTAGTPYLWTLPGTWFQPWQFSAMPPNFISFKIFKLFHLWEFCWWFYDYVKSTSVNEVCVQNLQAMEENRINRVQEFIQKSAETESNVLAILNTCVAGIKRAASTVNAFDVSISLIQKSRVFCFFCVCIWEITSVLKFLYLNENICISDMTCFYGCYNLFDVWIYLI